MNLDPMILKELDRIGCDESWHRLLVSVVGNFEGVELSTGDWKPVEEITYILRKIKDNDPSPLKEKLLVKNLAQLEAFQFRAMKFDGDSINTWNPLTEPYKSFINDAKGLHVYQDENNYPPPDVVMASISHMLRMMRNEH